MSVQPPYLRTFGIALICISAILALRNLPLMAGHGLAIVFYYVLAAFVFFIPLSLVCAELGSGWPQEGGIYAWIKAAFGERLAFFGVWLHWIEGVVCLPLFMYFTASILAYLMDLGQPKSSASDPIYLFWMMQSLLWGLTIANYYSPKLSNFISEFGTLLGTLLPGACIISLGAVWYLSGQEIPLDFSWQGLIPELRFDNLAFFSVVILSFAGIEVAAYHMRTVVKPKKTFPKAILIAVLLILMVYILGTLAVAMVVPKESLLFSTGVLQAFDGFLGHFGFEGWMPYLAGALFVGSVALLNTWIIGPCKGLMVGFQKGSSCFGRSNRFGAPGAVLIGQGMLSTVLSVVFVLFESSNTAYFLLTVIASQVFLILYGIIFIVAIYLRLKKATVERSYEIPGGIIGLSLVSGLGLLSCLLVFVLSFVAPAGVPLPANMNYPLCIGLGVLLLIAPPWVGFIFRRLQKKHKRK